MQRQLFPPNLLAQGFLQSERTPPTAAISHPFPPQDQRCPALFRVSPGLDSAAVEPLAAPTKDSKDSVASHRSRGKKRKGAKCTQLKRKWTPGEDEQLKELAMKYNGECWRQVATELQSGRTHKQCRDRWRNVLDSRISRDELTEEDKEQILELWESFPTQFADIGRKLIPPRPDNVVKNFIYSLARKKVREIAHAEGKLKHRPKNPLAILEEYGTLHGSAGSENGSLSLKRIYVEVKEREANKHPSTTLSQQISQASDINHSVPAPDPDPAPDPGPAPAPAPRSFQLQFLESISTAPARRSRPSPLAVPIDTGDSEDYLPLGVAIITTPHEPRSTLRFTRIQSDAPTEH